MTELARIDRRLAEGANRKVDPRARSEEEIETLSKLKGAARTMAAARIDGRIRGLFPREFRIPTETPPRDGWNHDWKPYTERKSP